MTGKRKAAKSKKLKKTTTTDSNQSLKRLQHIKESDHAVTVPKLKKPIVAPSGKTFYPCQLCTKIFPKEATCRSHMERCSKKQKELATNNKYRTENSETIQFPCQHCPKTFQKERTFVVHTEKCSNKDKLKVIDEETTKQKETEDDFEQIKCDSKEENNEAQQHQKDNNLKKFKPMRAPNGKLYYPCQYCNQIFVKELTYQNHLKKCPKKETLDMEVEKTDIVTSTSHMEVGKSDTVTATSDPFGNLIAYCNYNVDRIFIKKYLKCKLCPFLAKKPLDLLKHRRTEHAVSKIIVPINEAERYFDLPDRRRCPICKKRLVKKSKSSYINHLLVHTAGLIYACRICKKKFRRVDCLRDHEKRHVITFDEYQAIQNAFYEDDKD